MIFLKALLFIKTSFSFHIMNIMNRILVINLI